MHRLQRPKGWGASSCYLFFRIPVWIASNRLDSIYCAVCDVVYSVHSIPGEVVSIYGSFDQTF